MPFDMKKYEKPQAKAVKVTCNKVVSTELSYHCSFSQ